MKASYSGFGWMLIKRGVFEKMKYPWFSIEWHKFTNGWVDFSSEDASFCLKAKEAGFDILIHPDVIVGHEKRAHLLVYKRYSKKIYWIFIYYVFRLVYSLFI